VSTVAAGELTSPGLAQGEVRYVRSPSDLLRLVIALVLVAIGLLVTFAAHRTLGDLEREVLALFDGLPGALRRFLVGVIQIVAIVVPVATAVTLAVLRRWRTLLLALLAGVVADLLVYGVEQAADRISPASLDAAPTPGGVGAVEAVLIAGLTAVGVDKEIAVPSVFLFRLATFWLPVLPGWLAFHHLTRRGML
jgi:hypothetical protein